MRRAAGPVAALLLGALTLLPACRFFARPEPLPSSWPAPPAVPYVVASPVALSPATPGRVALDRPRKILLVGFDGVSWTVLDQFLRDGLMPNLDRFLREASYGLLATDEAFSPISWTSIATGKERSKHGISYDLPLATVWNGSACALKAAPIWDILRGPYPRQAFLRYYFPPLPDERADRIVFSGFTSPVYPNELTGAVQKAADLDATIKDAFPLPLREDAREMSVLERLLGRIDRDFVAAIYRLTDALLHDDHLAFHLAYSLGRDRVTLPAGSQALLDRRVEVYREVYRRMDRQIGVLLGPEFADALIVLASDHGSTPSLAEPSKIVPTVEFLQTLGGGAINYSSGTPEHGVTKAESVTVPLRIRDLIPVTLTASRHLYPIPAFTDRQTGKSYFKYIDVPDLAFRVADREDAAALETVEAELAKLKLFDRRLYRCFAQGPLDLLCQWNPDVRSQANVFNIPSAEPPAFLAITHSLGHHLDPVPGFFAIRGRNVKPGHVVAGARLFDIVPTICYLAQVPVADDLDGVVLKDAVMDEYLDKVAVRRVSTIPPVPCDPNRKPADALPPEVRERLRMLGYLP